MAFSENLREAVSKTHKISLGLVKDYLLHPVRSFLHWESFKNKLPSVVIPEDSKMRERLDRYMGYERHKVKFDEDFWQRRKKNESSLAGLEQHTRGLEISGEPMIELSMLAEKARQRKEGV